MVKSNFRLKVIFHRAKYSVPGVIASILIQYFIGYAFKYNLLFYVFYPLVYLGTLASLGYSGLKALYLFSQIIYTVFIVYYSWRIFPVPNIEFLKCPCCSKDVSVFYRWACSVCSQEQDMARYVTDRCDKCKNLSAAFICDNCEKEFSL